MTYDLCRCKYEATLSVDCVTWYVGLLHYLAVCLVDVMAVTATAVVATNSAATQAAQTAQTAQAAQAAACHFAKPLLGPRPKSSGPDVSVFS